MLGSLGDIVFEVSDDKAFTFRNLKASTGAKYQTHERIGGAPLLERVSDEVDTLSFNIKISVFWGIDPAAEMQKIDEAKREGTLLRFILGKNQIGAYRWVITKADYTVKQVDNKGNILSADVSLSLSAYNER